MGFKRSASSKTKSSHLPKVNFALAVTALASIILLHIQVCYWSRPSASGASKTSVMAALSQREREGAPYESERASRPKEGNQRTLFSPESTIFEKSDSSSSKGGLTYSMCRSSCKKGLTSRGTLRQRASAFCKRHCSRLRQARDLSSQFGQNSVNITTLHTGRAYAHLNGRVLFSRLYPFPPLQTVTFSGIGEDSFLSGVGHNENGPGNDILTIKQAGLYFVYGQLTFNDHRREKYNLQIEVDGLIMVKGQKSNIPIIKHGHVKRRGGPHSFRRNIVKPGGQDAIPFPDVRPDQRNNFVQSVSVGRITYLHAGAEVQIIASGSDLGEPTLLKDGGTGHYFGLYQL